MRMGFIYTRNGFWQLFTKINFIVSIISLKNSCSFISRLSTNHFLQLLVKGKMFIMIIYCSILQHEKACCHFLYCSI